MHLGLCTNKFNLFRSFAAPYSYWSVIFIAYNLPLRMCMRLKFMFLSMVIHNPNSLDQNIDVFLQSLIDELKQLWSSGTLDYDVFRKQNFLIKETLMWTINDFLAYKMVSSWRIHGKLACPYCMENNKAFTLTNNGKTSFFYCHQRFLPTDHRFKKNRNDFFVGRVERDVAPLSFSSEELYNMVSEYDDIVFGFQFGKQKFLGFGLIHNWVNAKYFLRAFLLEDQSPPL